MEASDWKPVQSEQVRERGGEGERGRETQTQTETFNFFRPSHVPTPSCGRHDAPSEKIVISEKGRGRDREERGNAGAEEARAVGQFQHKAPDVRA